MQKFQLLRNEINTFTLSFSPSTLRILAGAFNQTAQDQEQTLDVQEIFVVKLSFHFFNKVIGSASDLFSDG